jgi:nitroreductase
MAQGTLRDPQHHITFLRRLRAVRQFRAEPIAREVLDALLEVARWSGSASNQQPWELVVVRDPAARQAIARCEGFAGHAAQADMVIVLVLAGNTERVEHETYDEGRLSERMMLAASAFGVGSCIGWLRGQGPQEVKTLLGIPQERRVRTILSFGYPDEQARSARAPQSQARKPLVTIVHTEHYQAPV